MTGNKITFWSFIQKNKIEIPIIQRDYAQGRLGKEYLRQGFLTNLKEALDEEDDEKELKLDFVYGSVENGKLQPLDGQQRLTTLWLLHWYIALRSGKLGEAGCILKNFTYETRVSSREFCEHLCDESNFSSFICTDGKDSGRCSQMNIVDFIIGQTWFYSAWKQDPTIQSMLRMLGGTKINNKKGEDIIDGIEELFSNASFEEMESYWQKLTNNSPIVFYYLPLKEFGLSDDLYIKMNARGKQLTMFENFKADLIGFIQGQAESEQDNSKWKRLSNEANGIAIKMDTTWTDIFWRNRSESKRIDEIYFAFINRYILNSLILGLNSADVVEGNKNFCHLYGNKGNDTALQYTSFEFYKIPSLEVALEKLQTTLENFHSFISDKKEEALKDIQKEFLPLWDKQDSFRFIPEYEDDTITALTQSQRVAFHAICRYFELGKYEKESFNRWMRVVWNLVANGNINSIESMIGSLRLIDELGLHSHEIYGFLASDETIKSNVASEQQNEEREKAKKIIENINWEEIIVSAEKYAFFKGAVRFLFRNENGEWNWRNFNRKWNNTQVFFGKEGAYQKDTMLLRYFISKFMDWSLFEGMTFDNAGSSWRTVLLDKKWMKPIHEILISDNIEIEDNYQSVLMSSDNIQKRLQEDLVSTNLLDYIVSDCLLHNNVLYPSNAKADWKKYVIANKRNEILSSLYGGKILDNDKQEGKIYTNQKIEINCDFFWGWNIQFEYVHKSFPYKFHWQSWGWIDMYEGDIRLIDKKTPFTDKLVIDACLINTTEDLTRELERCINDYMEYKKVFVDNAIP